MNRRLFKVSLTAVRSLPGEDTAGGVWADPADPDRLRKEYAFLGEALHVEINGDLLNISVPEPGDIERERATKAAAKAAESSLRGDYKRAHGFYAKALSADPGRLETRRDLAMVEFELGNHQKARTLLREVLLLNPHDHWAHVVMANSFVKRDRDLDRGEQHFLCALQVAPEDPWALNGLGVLFLEKGCALDALDVFNRVVNAAPAFANGHLGRARALELLSRHQEASAALERLFVEADRADARSVPVFTDARKSYLRIESRLAEDSQESVRGATLRLKGELEQAGGMAIRIEEDLTGGLAGLIQMAWKHGRDYHVLKVRSSSSGGGLPPYGVSHITAHELHHLLIEQGARAQGRNRFFITDRDTVGRACASFHGDADRLRKRGMQEEEIAGYFEQVVKGACGLLFNAPIDMLIERRIRRELPSLRHAQFCSQNLLASEALAATLNQDARRISPRRILAINDAINGAYALFLDDLFEGTTAHFAPYARLEGSRVSRDLHEFWKSRAEGVTPGDEYGFVDEFAGRLGMQGWFRWLEDPGPWTIKEHLADLKEGTTNPALLSEKAPAAVMYLIGALRRFAGLTKTRIREIAFEIAVLGRSGLDYASPAQQYSLHSLPGETFSGLQLMCLMYVGFKKVEPELDPGISLHEEYRQAVAMFEAGL